jgi:hypothetical protein
MSSKPAAAKSLRSLASIAALFAFVLIVSGSHAAAGADALPQVDLDVSAAGPRAVEALTEHSIARDYGIAWRNMAQAFAANTPGLLDGYFNGTARSELASAIRSQQKNGLRTQYSGQSHKLRAVFYAPEGDAMELQDTADLEQQLLDGNSVIHQRHVVLHYVVLMTPEADRWVVRQMQAVPQF